MVKTFFFLSLLLTIGVFAQDKGAIIGKIIDLNMNHEPLSMANVQLKGQLKIAQTNFHGIFELKNISTGDHTLVITFAGYDKLEVPVRIEKNKITNVQYGLSQKSIQLEALIVNQSDKKKELEALTDISQLSRHK